MAECRLVVIKRNGADLSEQVLPPESRWTIGRCVGILQVFKRCLNKFSCNHNLYQNTNSVGRACMHMCFITGVFMPIFVYVSTALKTNMELSELLKMERWELEWLV